MPCTITTAALGVPIVRQPRPESRRPSEVVRVGRISRSPYDFG